MSTLSFGPQGLSHQQRWAMAAEGGAGAVMYEKIHPAAFHHLDELHAEGLRGLGVSEIVIDLEENHAEAVLEVLSECAPDAHAEVTLLRTFLDSTSILGEARVANLSIDTTDTKLRDAVLAHPNVLFVFSAGNLSGRAVGTGLTTHVISQVSSGRYEMKTHTESIKREWAQNGAPKNVLLVSYTTPTGKLAPAAADPQRSEKLEDAFVSCLGQVTMNDGKESEGSSFATPVAAAAAALLMQAEPSLSAAQVREALVRSSRGRLHVLDAPRALVYARLLANRDDPATFETRVAERERPALEVIRRGARPYISKMRARFAERFGGGDAQLEEALRDPLRPMNAKSARDAVVSGGASVTAWLVNNMAEIQAMKKSVSDAVPTPSHMDVQLFYEQWKNDRDAFEHTHTALPLLRELSRMESSQARAPTHTAETLKWATENWQYFPSLARNYDVAQVAASVKDKALVARFARIHRQERGARLLAAVGALELSDLDNPECASTILKLGAPGLKPRDAVNRALKTLADEGYKELNQGKRTFTRDELEKAIETFALEHPETITYILEDPRVSQATAERVMRRHPELAVITRMRHTSEHFFESIGRHDLAGEIAGETAQDLMSNMGNRTFAQSWAFSSLRARAAVAKRMKETDVSKLPEDGAIAAEIANIRPDLLKAAHQLFPGAIEATDAFKALPPLERLNMQTRPDPAEALAAVRSGSEVKGRALDAAASVANIDDFRTFSCLRLTLRGLEELVKENAYEPFLAEMYGARLWPPDKLPDVNAPPSLTVVGFSNFIRMSLKRGAFDRVYRIFLRARDAQVAARRMWNELADNIIDAAMALRQSSERWWTEGTGPAGTDVKRACLLAINSRFDADGVCRLSMIAKLILNDNVVSKLSRAHTSDEQGLAIVNWIAPMFARLYGTSEAALADLGGEFPDIAVPMRPGDTHKLKIVFAVAIAKSIERMKGQI